VDRSWSRPGFWAIIGSHVLADFYVGAVGATLPYFVTKANYSYADIAGLALAQTTTASIAQPGFGLLADKYRLRWAVPACIAATGLCMSLSTLRPTEYVVVWLLIAAAGLASAGYHPPATMVVRELAPGSNVAMSFFAAAGNSGVALGPLAVVAVVGPLGLSGTVWLTVPGIAGLAIYGLAGTRDQVLRQRVRPARSEVEPPALEGPRVLEAAGAEAARQKRGPREDAADRWGWFGLLMGSMTVWQLCFVAANTFIGVFMIREFGASEAAASVPLALIPASGATGTLLGGCLADRGRLATIRLGYPAALIGSVAIATAPAAWLAVVGTCLLGAGIFLPFAPHITLSHSYLPRRVGAATGISIGVTSAIGGLLSAGLGHLADVHGLRLVFVILAVALVAGTVIGFLLREPDRPGRASAGEPPVTAEVTP
jgi:FSR family fosmidomycin resistance protein-like MFS transporter